MNNYSIDIAKKKIEKVIIEELYCKDIIDFFQFNNINKRIDEDVLKMKNNIINLEKNVIVNISL